MAKEIQTEVTELKEQLEHLKETIEYQGQITRQILWFGDYSFYSENLVFDKTTLTIKCPKEVKGSYCSAFLYIPVHQFKLRILNGNVCMGFVTLKKPIDLNKGIPGDCAHMLYYDRTYFAEGRVIDKTQLSIQSGGVVTITYDPKTHIIIFECEGKQEKAFKNIDGADLYPILSFKPGSLVQVL